MNCTRTPKGHQKAGINATKMATKEVQDEHDIQNTVYNQRLDNLPRGDVDCVCSDMGSRQGAAFCSYHDSDSDIPDVELRSMSSFLGVDLDKSDAESWDWTFPDENVSDLDVKPVPVPQKTEQHLADINEDLRNESVDIELDSLHHTLQDNSMKRLKSLKIDQTNKGRFNNIEDAKTYIFQSNAEIGAHDNDAHTPSLQKGQNEQMKTVNSHKKRIHITPSSVSGAFCPSPIQSNKAAVDNGTLEDDFVYFKDGLSSKVFKRRLQYLSNDSNVGGKLTKTGANKCEKNGINKRSSRARFITRSTETTHSETRNITTKFTKLNSTEARFMCSGSPDNNNAHLRTMPSQGKKISSPLSLPKSDSLPARNDKGFDSFMGKRHSLNEHLADRITSWRLNRGWARSRQDMCANRQVKEEELLEDKVSPGGATRRQSWAGDAGLRRFRHVVRMVLILLKAVGRRHEKPEDTNYNFLSWTVVYDEVLGISRLNYDSGALTFDPLLFKANRESTLSPEIKDILRLPPDHRTEAHIRTVMMCFHNVVPSFSEYPKDIQQSMIKVCMYEKFEPGRVIIRQGHRAENFYFIIGGRAVVTQMDSQAGHVHTTNVLGKGNSFGELAFLHMSERSATVTCRDDVELLCIEREDFINIFMRPRQGDEPDHIKFLKSVDILRGWPVSLLPHANPKICAFTYVRRDVILCHDNSCSDWIFVVYSGTCKVLTALDDGPVQELDPRTHGKGVHIDASLTPNSSNISKVYKANTPKATSDRTPKATSESSHKQGRREQASGCRRQCKHGVSLPPIRLFTSGLANGNKAETSFSHVDHLENINNIFYRKHVLPTILRNNQVVEESHEETSSSQVSNPTSILPNNNPAAKHKRQSFGLHPPVLPQLVVPLYATATTQQQHRPLRKTAFIEIARLEPGDIFGLEHVVLSGIRTVASCSLVSEGAEVVLISKSFFKRHLTEDTIKRMRQLIRPLPSEKALQKKFHKKKLWDVYKSHTIAMHSFGRRDHGAAPHI